MLTRRLWQQRPACLRPIHCGISCHGTVEIFFFHLMLFYQFTVNDPVLNNCCYCIPLSGDQTLAETVANVLTSIPFIALGIHAPR